MTTDSANLARVRDQIAAIGPGEWSRVFDAEGSFVEARGPRGELWEMARFHAGASEAEIAFVIDAPRNMRFLLGLVDRAIVAARQRPDAGHDQNSSGEARKDDCPSRHMSRPAGAPAAKGGETAREAKHSDAKDFTAQCAMTCARPAFRVFLEERHGLERPLTDERVAQKVRSMLGVTSRRELNSDSRAANAWAALRRDFEAWKRQERG